MLLIPRPRYDEIVEHALEEREREVCGILGGRFGPERSLVRSVHRTANVADNPGGRYRIDPEEQLSVFGTIEAEKDDVLGFYHSHPNGPPAPSVTDTARAAWPDYSYLIVALDGHPYVGAWRFRAEERTFEREHLVLTRSS